MTSSSDELGALLTASQEYQLFEDHEVGSMMTLLDNSLEQFNKSQELKLNQQQLQSNTMYEPKPYQHQFDQGDYQQQLIAVTQQEYNNINVVSFVGLEEPVPPTIPPPFPEINNTVIRNEEYAGPYNFEVFIDPHHGTKNPWVYSSMLNKLFITVFNPFPIDFKWESKRSNLFVRAMPLFSLAQHAQDLVARCIPHRLPKDTSNRNAPESIWDHVIRCQSNAADYQGDVDNNRHLNVVVPLGSPQTGTDCVRLMYSFMCKNSCTTGMNRKPFEVVFTLEDELGNIHGRRKLNVRVCSCPKRDKEKEEKSFLVDGVPPQGKKRKLEKNGKRPPSSVDEPLTFAEIPLTLPICGKHNLKLVLKYAHDLMAGELIRHGPNAAIQKCINTLGEQIKNTS